MTIHGLFSAPVECVDFQCGNGDCLSQDSVCNGVPDCEDGSDELNCCKSHCSKL